MTKQNEHRILVIDDDDVILTTVKSILSSEGYAVLTADTGENGLNMASTENPDLIILDVILPKMKGREVCKKLKELEATRDIPVVFLTAKCSADDIQAELDAGGQAHLTKPVHAESLLKTVRCILNA